MKCQKCGFKNPKGARCCGCCQNELPDEGIINIKTFFVLIVCITLGGLLALFLIPEDGWHNQNGEYAYYRDGKKLEGLQKIDGNRYYFNDSGVMQTGWIEVNGRTVHFADDGKMETGLQVIDNDLYYFTANGEITTGWMTIGGDTYFFLDNGKAVTSLQTIEGSKYYFCAEGKMATDFYTINGTKYYFGDDGKMRTGLHVIKGETYYFDAYGRMKTGEQKIDEGDLVGVFSDDGKLEYFIDNAIAQKIIDEQIYFENRAGEETHSYYKTLHRPVHDCSYLSINLEITENKIGKGDGEWQVHLRELDGDWVHVGFFRVSDKKGIFETSFENPISFDAFVCTRYSASTSWSGSFKQNLSEIRYKSRG